MKTKNIEIPDYQKDFILSVFRKLKISDFSIESKNQKIIISANISGRKMKKVKRCLWAKKKTEDTGIRHLTREDADSSFSGIIPESEAFYFKKSSL